MSKVLNLGVEQLNVPINEKERQKRAAELYEAADADAATNFGRELIDATYEAYQDSDVDDPMEAITSGSSAGSAVGYDPDERRDDRLTAGEVKEIVTELEEPEIRPVHLPSDAGDALANQKQRVELCLAVARYRHETLSREDALETVEIVLGRGSNDYYVDVDKADIPGQMLDACYREPSNPLKTREKRRYTSSDAYVSTWVGHVETLRDTDMDEISSKGRVKKCAYACKDLNDQGERLLIALEDENRVDMVDELLDILDDVGAEYAAEVEARFDD
jgi:hypothetical protein